jgi:EAL and modified HD-GYP domain-containing signal transduction protein
MVGRQPVFARNREVFGYELLFRGMTALNGAAQQLSGDTMTSDVLVRLGLDCGLPAMVGDRRIFMVTPRSFVIGRYDVPFAPESVVLQIPNAETRDPDLLAGGRRLVDQGFTLSLSNYEWRTGDEPFLDLVDMIKVDTYGIQPEDIASDMDRYNRFDLTTVAARVETHAQLAACEALGFDLFQGYVLSKPVVIQGRALSPHRATLLRLVDRLCDPDTETAELGAIVETDPGLASRLLRLAGAGTGPNRRIHSIREAVVLLGREQLRSWIFLMLTSDSTNAVPEQVTLALTRAKMCQLIAADCLPRERESAFTAGLVSALDLILEAPIAAIVEQMGLADTLSSAILDHTGDLGRILADVLAWEIGLTWLRSPLEPGAIERSYVDALAWTNSVLGRATAAAAA